MECEFCNIRFSFENDLMAHITSEHTVTLPYECKDCDASFSKTHDLKRHIDLGHEFKIPEKITKNEPMPTEEEQSTIEFVSTI